MWFLHYSYRELSGKFRLNNVIVINFTSDKYAKRHYSRKIIDDIGNDLSNFLQVIEAKTDAINNRIDRLQAYVVSDDIARDLAEGNKLKVKATL